MTTPTIATLLELDEDRLSKDLSHALESVDGMPAISAAAAAVYASFADRLTSAVGGALKEALNAPITDTLAMAWNRYRPLRKYRNESEYPPDEIIEVVLGHHRVSISEEPRVEVLVNGLRTADVTFQVDLELSVESVCLRIQGGRIKELAPGKCRAKGTVKCEGALLAEQSTKDLSIPGAISLGEGIPIL